MTIAKSFLATLLFILLLMLTSVWMVLDSFYDISFLIENYRIINRPIQVLIVLFFIYKQQGLYGILPRQTHKKYYVGAFILGICYPYIQILLSQFYNFAFALDYDISINLDLEGFTWNSLVIILISPISEEMVFRQYIQKGLQEKYHHIIAIGLASILFASIHLPYLTLFTNDGNFSPYHAYLTLFGGVMAGYLYYKSKSIGPSILFHIVWNLIVCLR